MAMILFKKGMEGYEHAETFERSHRESRHGGEAWWYSERDREMYGWLLTKEEVEYELQSRQWPPSLKDLLMKQMHKGTKTREEVSKYEVHMA